MPSQTMVRLASGSWLRGLVILDRRQLVLDGDCIDPPCCIGCRLVPIVLPVLVLMMLHGLSAL